MTRTNQIAPTTCHAKIRPAMDTLMEYALAVYSFPSERLNIFDTTVLEQDEKEYNKWKQSLSYSCVIPLGLRREEYVLGDIEGEEGEIEMEGEEEESEEEEEEDEEEIDEMNDFYDGDSDIMEESTQDVRRQLNLDDIN